MAKPRFMRGPFYAASMRREPGEAERPGVFNAHLMLKGQTLMMSNPKKSLLAGLFIGALVIAAALMPSRDDKLSGVQPGAEHDAATISSEMDNGPAQAPRSYSSSANGHSDDIFYILRAFRESLKRDDRASAKVLMGPVQTLPGDDSREVSVQDEPQAREEKAASVPPVAQSDNPRITAKLSRSAARKPVRSKRSHDGALGVLSVRGHAIDAPRLSRTTDAPPITTSSNHALDALTISPALGVGRTVSGSPDGTSVIAGTPPRSASIPAKAPIREALPPVQIAVSKPFAVQSDQGPKTRAQVRAELNRARADGSLPRFGNPNPAGPGGVPSSTSKEFGSE